MNSKRVYRFVARKVCLVLLGVVLIQTLIHRVSASEISRCTDLGKDRQKIKVFTQNAHKVQTFYGHQFSKMCSQFTDASAISCCNELIDSFEIGRKQKTIRSATDFLNQHVNQLKCIQDQTHVRPNADPVDATESLRLFIEAEVELDKLDRQLKGIEIKSARLKCEHVNEVLQKPNEYIFEYFLNQYQSMGFSKCKIYEANPANSNSSWSQTKFRVFVNMGKGRPAQVVTQNREFAIERLKEFLDRGYCF